jgi:hypothetical protein
MNATIGAFSAAQGYDPANTGEDENPLGGTNEKFQTLCLEFFVFWRTIDAKIK